MRDLAVMPVRKCYHASVHGLAAELAQGESRRGIHQASPPRGPISRSERLLETAESLRRSPGDK